MKDKNKQEKKHLKFSIRFTEITTWLRYAKALNSEGKFDLILHSQSFD
jgi:negative regulator of genetic competence, sporulation and motility